MNAGLDKFDIDVSLFFKWALPALLVNAHNRSDYEDDTKRHKDSNQDDGCFIYETESR